MTIDEFFDANGVRVPHIVAKDLEQGLLLLEDFGDVVLSTLLNDKTVDQYYAQSFKQLIELQQIDGNLICRHIHMKLMTEMRLLTEWMLPSLNIQPTEQQLETIEQAFDFLAIEATNQPQVIVHRDFHSRNLMKIENEQELGVIDFKMR